MNRRTQIGIAIVALVFTLAIGAAAAIYVRADSQMKRSTQELKNAVTHDFNDPESARFRSVRLRSYEGSISMRIKMISPRVLWESTPDVIWSLFTYDPELFTLCGEVNAKNAFGAYVGYKRFYVGGRTDRILFLDESEGEDLAKELCEIGGEDFIVYREADHP